MRIGSSLHAVTDFGHDVKPFHEGLADLAACGFESVMLLDRPGPVSLQPGGRPGCCLIDLAASDPAAVREAVTAAGLAVAAVHRGCLAVADDDQAAGSRRALADAIALADRLGTHLVIPNAGVAPQPKLPTADKEPWLRRVAGAVAGALEGAAAKTRLAIDIHYGGVIETVADCQRLFELVADPRAGITLNIGHMTTLRQEGWRLIAEHPERVHVVAWKDHLLNPPPEATHPVYSVELGTGDSPFERYVAALRNTTLDAEHLITFEHVPAAEKQAALARSLRLWRSWWTVAVG